MPRLKPFQRAGVAFLVSNERTLLMDCMGTGKTAQSIRALQVLAMSGRDPFPTLVVCPNSTKYTVWAHELATWAPELRVQVIDGSAAVRRKQLARDDVDVFVINWESVRLHSRLAPYGSIALSDTETTPKELNDLGPRTVIVDEAHRGKDPHAKQTRATWAVAHQAEFRFALTGTPVADHLGDLWSLLHLIEPTWFPAKSKFMDRYAEITLNTFGGAEVIGVQAAHRAELFSVVDPLTRRLPKEAALPQLPPKLPTQYRHTPMTTSQARAYRSMEESMLTLLDSGGLLAAPDTLSQLTRLLQFASSAATLGDDGQVKLTLPSSKVDDLVDFLDELGDEPLVVAAVSRQLIELAAKKLGDLGITRALVTGAQSALERQQAVAAFQAGRVRVILLTLGAGAEGLTLTRASKMLFMQRSWSAIQNDQAEARIHRIGAERHDVIEIIEQITPGTVEERKVALLKEKGRRIDEIVRDRETLHRLLRASR